MSFESRVSLVALASSIQLMAVKPIPDGYHTVTPYLIVNAGRRALESYEKAFGATEVFTMDAPGGRSDTPRSRSVTRA